MTDAPSAATADRARLPDRLRAAWEAEDRRPVRPLLPPFVRALLVVGTSVVVVAVVLLQAGLRADAMRLGGLVVWGPAVVRALAGGVLLWLALRDGVPGSGPSSLARGVGLLAVPLVVVVLADLVAREAGVATDPRRLECMSHGLLIAIPGVTLVAWLLARAWAVHPVWAAVAAAAGVGLLADGALHLVCPATARTHTLLAHGGAVALLMAAAALVGFVAARRRP